MARSNRRNHVRLIHKLHTWRRDHGRELGAARELMFQASEAGVPGVEERSA